MTAANQCELQWQTRELTSGTPDPVRVQLGKETLTQLEHEGLLPWIRWRLRSTGLLDSMPDEVQVNLNTAARAVAIQELDWEEELHQLADMVADFDVLLFKGMDLARRVYPEPGLRPRCDADLLVNPNSFVDLASRLVDRGYQRQTAIDAPLISRQSCFVRNTASGSAIALDVHWSFSNRPALQQALPIDAVMNRAIAAPPPLDAFKVPDLMDALLIACIHRIAHHRRDRRAVWLLDLHFLWLALSDKQRKKFADHALSSGVGALCAEGLSGANRYFCTGVPDPVISALRHNQGSERAAILLDAAHNRWEDFKFDFGSLSGLRSKAAFLRQHLFPDRQYMRQRFATHPGQSLAPLYLSRIAKGVGKLLRGSRT